MLAVSIVSEGFSFRTLYEYSLFIFANLTWRNINLAANLRPVRGVYKYRSDFKYRRTIWRNTWQFYSDNGNWDCSMCTLYSCRTCMWICFI